MQGPCRKDFITISARSSLKDLRKIIQPSSRMSAGSSQDLLIRTCTRFNHTRARAISKFAPRHSESDLTRQKSREGCANDIKIRTKPQHGRSDCSDERAARARSKFAPHITTTRAIEHVQSHERVARDKTAAPILCEPVQSKCTLTCRKGTFMREFAVKKPGPRWSTLI